MEPEYIISIGGEATSTEFYESFITCFGWDLRKQDYGVGTSVIFVKDLFGDLASEFEQRLQSSDPAYFMAIASLLSATGELHGIADKEFYQDVDAIRAIPFEFKVDFLYSNLLWRFTEGFVSWLGQRHLVIDRVYFNSLKRYLLENGLSVAVKKPSSKEN